MTDTFIPLAKPNITEQDIETVVSILKSGMLIQGKYCAELEKNIASKTNTLESIAVSNGTATMHLILKALGIKEGDEVIVPAFSYVATANVVELVGAKPVFVDIDIKTFNIDTTQIEANITPHTKAIIPVHEFGLACDIEAVTKIANKHSIFVIEDAACALGAMQNQKPVGSFGIAGSFSLHPRKSITSGEGGLVTTNNEDLARQIRILRNHGIVVENDKMVFEEAGFNYRLTDFQAGLALGQLNRLTEILDKKNKLAKVYFNEIDNNKITLPFTPTDRNHTWQTFHILLTSQLNQQAVINHLKQKGIGTNYGAQCIPAQKYYQSKYNYQNVETKFPNAYRAYKQGLAIPLYDLLTEEEALYISKQLNDL